MNYLIIQEIFSKNNLKQNILLEKDLQQRKLYPCAELKTSCKIRSDVILVNMLAATCSNNTQLSMYCFHSQYIVCNINIL